jgi:hypothetical protein
MDLIRPDLQLAVAACGTDVGGQLPGVADEHLGSARLDKRRRHRASRGHVQRQPRMGEIGCRTVQLDQSLGIAGADRRIAAQRFTGARQLEGEVDQRRHQHHRGRMGDIGLEQHVDSQMAASRVARDDDALRSQAGLAL